MIEPLPLSAQHSLAHENITNFYFLKGLYNGKEKFSQAKMAQALADIQRHKTQDWSTFQTGGMILCDAALGPTSEDLCGYLQYLDACGRGFSYESDSFYLRDNGKAYVACSALRFSVELPGSARKLAEVLGTDLDSILLCGAKIIVPKDKYSPGSVALYNLKK